MSVLMVRVTGVEPVRLLPLPSENSMSTNSITLALKYWMSYKYKRY